MIYLLLIQVTQYIKSANNFYVPQFVVKKSGAPLAGLEPAHPV